MKKEERQKLLAAKLEEKIAFDRSFVTLDQLHIAGVDEVGRGPLAGPVVAACVVLPRDFDVIGIDDSKKLSEKKRVELAHQIKEKALAYGLAMADQQVIDQINILEATKGAMTLAIQRAEEMLLEKYGSPIDHLLLDAITLKDVKTPQTPVIGGDGKSLVIGAASILAKVTRDHMMVEYDKKYPGYSFATNKGYGTKAHYQGIEAQGICPIHRKTFLKNMQEYFDK